MSEATLLAEEHEQERVTYSAMLLEQIEKTDDVGGELFYVSGFVSMNTEDRHGDILNPTLFDLATYMKNPQLWINHGLWRTPSGNEIAVGVVESIRSVRVELSGARAVLFDLTSGEKVKVIESEKFLLEDKARGLWVVCRVAVPEVAQLIRDGRLNAFSWQGVIYRNKRTGAIAKIDVYEVSLVNIPANQYALLQVGKMLHIQSAGGAHTVIDAEAVSSLLPRASHAGNADAAAAISTKGGDSEMDDTLLKVLTDRLDNVSTALAGVAGIAETVNSLAARIKALEDKDSSLADAAKAEADADAAAKKAEAEADAAQQTSAVEKKLAELTEAIAAVAALPDAIGVLGKRLEALEASPAQKKAIGDGNDAPNIAETRKKLSEIPRETAKAAVRRALGQAIVPPHVLNRRP